MYMQHKHFPLLTMKEVFILKAMWKKRSVWVKLRVSFSAPARGYIQ